MTQAEQRGGRWLVDVEHDGEAAAGFDARTLVVASGYNGVPFIPEFDGLESFQGEVVHSARYGDGARFAGQDVLVVRCGNSGAEIAIDLWEHGARPSLVVRNPTHVVPRDVFGMPVRPGIDRMDGSEVVFVNGQRAAFGAIVMATGSRFVWWHFRDWHRLFLRLALLGGN